MIVRVGWYLLASALSGLDHQFLGAEFAQVVGSLAEAVVRVVLPGRYLGSACGCVKYVSPQILRSF